MPADRRDEVSGLFQRLRTGERIAHFESERLAKDGRRVPISLTVSPIRDARGTVVGVSAIARDISAAKRAQLELDQALAAKEQFLAALSHELRTPLTPVLAAISLLEGAPDLPPALREELLRMRRNMMVEARLIDDLLDLTHIGRGQLSLHYEITDAHDCLHHVLTMCQTDIVDKNLDAVLTTMAEAHYVWADPVRLQQILLNLLQNAIKFTPPGGKISVASVNDPHGRLILEVADSGLGIPPDALEHVFNPFSQTGQPPARRAGGLGLGLGIAKALVEMHHGTLTAHSQGEGKGAAFTVTLDTVQPPDESSQSSSDDTPLRNPAHIRILLVDDHPDTVAVLAKTLGHCGYQVQTAISVQEARTHLESSTFDVLLCDLGLPDGTGWDVMEFAKARQAIKGIALSGYGAPADMRKSQEAGFALHLTKPIAFETLEFAIHNIVG